MGKAFYSALAFKGGGFILKFFAINNLDGSAGAGIFCPLAAVVSFFPTAKVGRVAAVKAPVGTA